MHQINQCLPSPDLPTLMLSMAQGCPGVQHILIYIKELNPHTPACAQVHRLVCTLQCCLSFVTLTSRKSIRFSGKTNGERAQPLAIPHVDVLCGDGTYCNPSGRELQELLVATATAASPVCWRWFICRVEVNVMWVGESIFMWIFANDFI